MTTRRTFIKILGGGLIASGAGVGTFAVTRTPTRALAPWEQANAFTDPIERALGHALLAPNPHNRQPWLVDLSQADEVTILRDPDRDLPMTDPFNRQIFIGLGCFIENMVIAASQTGHSVSLDILPEGDDGPVAVARFREGAQEDPLARYITTRHSAKDAYTSQGLSAEDIRRLSQYVDVITDEDTVQYLRDLTWEAFQLEVFTERTFQESVDLMRIGKREINANPDGLEMRELHLDALYSVGLLTRDMLAETSGAAFEAFMNGYRDVCYATPAYTLLKTRGNTRLDQIQAGQTWMRNSLAVTALGLGTHPMSQALQEFPEMSDLYSSIHGRLAQSGETIQMLARIGHGSPAVATPRWELETRVIDG
ncbi:MAG: twin-arginine translocation pathway signal protein [Pseudomonadota bacterium]